MLEGVVLGPRRLIQELGRELTPESAVSSFGRGVAGFVRPRESMHVLGKVEEGVVLPAHLREHRPAVAQSTDHLDQVVRLAMRDPHRDRRRRLNGGTEERHQRLDALLVARPKRDRERDLVVGLEASGEERAQHAEVVRIDPLEELEGSARVVEVPAAEGVVRHSEHVSDRSVVLVVVLHGFIVALRGPGLIPVSSPALAIDRWDEAWELRSGRAQSAAQSGHLYAHDDARDDRPTG